MSKIAMSANAVSHFTYCLLPMVVEQTLHEHQPGGQDLVWTCHLCDIACEGDWTGSWKLWDCSKHHQRDSLFPCNGPVGDATMGAANMIYNKHLLFHYHFSWNETDEYYTLLNTLGLPRITTPYLALVKATFKRRGSLKKPMPWCSLLRTQLRIM